jgi:deuterolysin
MTGCGTDGVFAYVYPTGSVVYICQATFKAVGQTTSCHADDVQGTFIHELTHLQRIYTPATQDFAYGYKNCIALDGTQSIKNADSYEYFAVDAALTVLECPPPGGLLKSLL